MTNLIPIIVLLQLAMSLLTASIGTPLQGQAIEIAKSAIFAASQAIIDAKIAQNAPVATLSPAIPSSTPLSTPMPAGAPIETPVPTPTPLDPRFVQLPELSAVDDHSFPSQAYALQITWKIADADGTFIDCWDQKDEHINNYIFYQNRSQSTIMFINNQSPKGSAINVEFIKGHTYDCDFSLVRLLQGDFWNGKFENLGTTTSLSFFVP